ncbi:MAG: phosphoadenosine phosphosulfate reductase family protein [Desulfobacterales bacterium]|nr:phosphoadenosine phosphosulfate reductase family protein [Desulfobacterales bacterium]
MKGFFPCYNKVEMAIERIRLHQPRDGTPIWLGFSGGKDSQAIYRLVEMSGVLFEAHYNVTGVDPPELVYFIRKNYPDVKRDLPEKTMWKLIVENRIPPTRLMRYCCKFLKERHGQGVVMLGVRSQESSNRKGRGVFERCIKDEKKHYLNPIIDWTERDVWTFIKDQKLSYCSLYDHGRKRLGCLMCPQNPLKQRLIDAKEYPKFYQAYLMAFGRMLKIRKERGLGKGRIEWNTPEDVMRWWLFYSFKYKGIIGGQV